MSSYLYLLAVFAETREGTWSPITEVAAGSRLPRGSWERNLSLRQEQQALFNHWATSLAPRHMS